MKMQQALRETVLGVAKREGWAHLSVRVTIAPKNNKAAISLAISGQRDLGVDRVLRRELDALRDRQTENVRKQWPEIEIKSIVIHSVTSTGSTVVGTDNGS